ncbi:hypothetical protein PR202_ga12478 [Eleusine coracana subsp. coracana]|uniref:Disease resistance R13L4/SHOC-2-like LRR domain-containing protein n=1 Tax=Eleusine coracana subsp. coracana TaxID=191504 RepID=A0AAV5CCB4_ELECO|nr:hypothetical protein PR202_ga12478 [Eleusine coracana subsp. coracana]
MSVALVLTQSWQVKCDFLSCWFPVPRNLQRLTLSFCTITKIPEWISQLDNLTSLKIRVKELQRYGVELLGELPCLAYLDLSVSKEPKEDIIFHRNAYPRLREFGFAGTQTCQKTKALVRDSQCPYQTETIIVRDAVLKSNVQRGSFSPHAEVLAFFLFIGETVELNSENNYDQIGWIGTVRFCASSPTPTHAGNCSGSPVSNGCMQLSVVWIFRVVCPPAALPGGQDVPAHTVPGRSLMEETTTEQQLAFTPSSSSSLMPCKSPHCRVQTKQQQLAHSMCRRPAVRSWLAWCRAPPRQVVSSVEASEKRRGNDEGGEWRLGQSQRTACCSTEIGK